MEKVRINNDLLIKYTVLRDGLPESFVGATDITVTVTNEAYKKAISNTFDIVGNIVNISIDAADFNLCGKYRVTLKYVRGNDIEIDALAFEGVQYTSLTGGTEIVGVEIVTVNISGDIGIAIPDNNKIDLDGLNSNIDKLHFNPNTLVELSNIGDVRYSQESRTLEVKVSDTVYIQLGQEMQTRIKNDAGVQINNGQLVYIDSAAGANPLAKIASTTDANIAQRTFGMATENIANNGFGAITTEGLVRDVNTAAFTEGEMLWLGVNGAVTNIEPVAPTPKISIGMVLRSNVANGVIYVKIRAISRNQKLSDVYAPTLTGGDILRWNSTTLRFETFNVTTALAGKADLVGGKIPTSQLPAYVDDVLEYANLAAFPATGETGKIYVALDTNLTYRWSGTAYVEISKSLALGETSSTAYRGDRGKIAYDHSQATGNPHGSTATQIPNTPAGTIAATTVQGAINELDGDIAQVRADLNTKLSYNFNWGFGYLTLSGTLINNTSTSVYRTTDYILLSDINVIDFILYNTTPTGALNIGFFRSDKTFISGVAKTKATYSDWDIPQDAVYVRFVYDIRMSISYLETSFTNIQSYIDKNDNRIESIADDAKNIVETTCDYKIKWYYGYITLSGAVSNDVDTSVWRRTDYLLLSEITVQDLSLYNQVTSTVLNISFYDSNKVLLTSGKVAKSLALFSDFIIPENAVYVRFCYDNRLTPNFVKAIIKNMVDYFSNLYSNNTGDAKSLTDKLMVNNTPLSVIKKNAGFGGIIHDWGFIGDSLSSGVMNYNSGANTVAYYDYSWGQNLCKLLGVSGYNFSRGGMTAKDFALASVSDVRGLAYALLPENHKQAYTIALGVNDAMQQQASQIYDNTNNGGWGNVSTDINDSDSTLNANTFAGYMGQIIQKIRMTNPRCIFFLLTNPKNSIYPYYMGNPIIRDLAIKFSNVFVIDLELHAVDFSTTDFKDKYIYYSHLNVLGYQYLSYVVNTYVDYIIRNNPHNFRDIAYWNTDKYMN